MQYARYIICTRACRRTVGIAVDDGGDAGWRQLGQRVLAAYGIDDPSHVVSVTLDMQATGVPLVCIRLLLTDDALDAMRAEP